MFNWAPSGYSGPLFCAFLATSGALYTDREAASLAANAASTLGKLLIYIQVLWSSSSSSSSHSQPETCDCDLKFRLSIESREVSLDLGVWVWAGVWAGIHSAALLLFTHRPCLPSHFSSLSFFRLLSRDTLVVIITCSSDKCELVSQAKVTTWSFARLVHHIFSFSFSSLSLSFAYFLLK